MGSGQTVKGGFPSMTYDEIMDFADMPQAPNADISGSKDKSDPDGVSDVKDEVVANTPNKVAPYRQFDGSSLDDLEVFLRQQMEAHKPESEEDRKKRERREKWEGVISGISDMGMALGNLFYTTKGAPNAYDAQSGMSAKAKERFERAKAEREKNEDRYMNYALALGKLQQQRADAQRAEELERRQDEKYQYELSRRPHVEDFQEQELKALKYKNNRNMMYDELASLQEEYAAGGMSMEQYRERQSEIYNAYHGKYGKYGTTYSRTTGPRGTSTTVRTSDASQLQAPVLPTASSRTSTSRGSGGKGGSGTTPKTTTTRAKGRPGAPANTGTGGKGKGYGDNKTQQGSKGRGY